MKEEILRIARNLWFIDKLCETFQTIRESNLKNLGLRNTVSVVVDLKDFGEFTEENQAQGVPWVCPKGMYEVFVNLASGESFWLNDVARDIATNVTGNPMWFPCHVTSNSYQGFSNIDPVSGDVTGAEVVTTLAFSMDSIGFIVTTGESLCSTKAGTWRIRWRKLR